MATFPSVLPRPDQPPYTYEVDSGVLVSPTTAKASTQRSEFERLRIHELSFSFTRGQARLFRQWIKDEIDNGYRPFDITLEGVLLTNIRMMDKPSMTGLSSDKYFSYSLRIMERL